MQAWVRIPTNYRKTDIDDKQENDLNHILKGVLGLQLHAGEGNVFPSLLSLLLLWGISQEGAADSSASPVPHWA